ncbi:MAG: hypothetical protein ACP5IL_17815, partial [Syntrophobacteraceae bacterium]
MKEKISHRFLAAFFIVAVIPIVIMGMGLYRAAENTLIKSAYMHIQTIAQDRANKLDTWYQERLGDIGVLSRLSAIRDLAAGAATDSKDSLALRTALVNDSLALTRGKSSAYESIHVISLSGRLIASTEPKSEMIVSKMYLKDLENMQAANGPVLSNLMQHSNREWYLHLTVPVFGKDTRMKAAVFSVLDAKGTQDPLLSDTTGLGKTGEAY